MSSIKESMRYYFCIVTIFIPFFEGCCNTKVPFSRNWSNKKGIVREEVESDEENPLSYNGNNTMNSIRFAIHKKVYFI